MHDKIDGRDKLKMEAIEEAIKALSKRAAFKRLLPYN